MPIKLSLAEDIIDRLLIFVGLTSRAPNLMGSSLTPVLPRALIGGANRSMVVGLVALRYKKRKGPGHACQGSSWPTSHFDITANPITKAQQRWEDSTPRRHHSRVTGLHQIRIFFLSTEQIYYHFTVRYLSADSNDVKFYWKAIWWDALTLIR
jgi:hypothetical protein